MLRVAPNVFLQELSADRPGGHHAVVALKTAPFGKVVGNVKGCR